MSVLVSNLLVAAIYWGLCLLNVVGCRSVLVIALAVVTSKFCEQSRQFNGIFWNVLQYQNTYVLLHQRTDD
jgi:hypothetical protein